LVTTELTCGLLSLKVQDAGFLFHFFLCKLIDICFCLQQVGAIKDEHSIFIFCSHPNQLLTAFLQALVAPAMDKCCKRRQQLAALNASPDVMVLSSCVIPLSLYEFMDGGAEGPYLLGQNLSLIGGWGSTKLYHNLGYCDHS
jgi:hypothetical protein